jgi:hypothetical protein
VEHVSFVHVLRSSQPPAHASSEPNPSWQVTIAPELRTTCAAAMAPVNFDVSTVTRALVATRSA